MRQSKPITITADMVVTARSRDVGKTFVITEMSSTAGEKWAGRAWLAIARSGVEIPEEFMGSGWAGIAMVSLQALRYTRFEEIEPLMDELMGCVQIMPDRARPDYARPLTEEDIEEIETRVLLKREVFDMHSGPFVEGVRSRLPPSPPKSPQGAPPPPDSRDTPTSRVQSQ